MRVSLGNLPNQLAQAVLAVFRFQHDPELLLRLPLNDHEVIAFTIIAAHENESSAPAPVLTLEVVRLREAAPEHLPMSRMP